MTTLFTTVNTTNEHSRRRGLWRLGGAMSVVTLALGLTGSYAVRGQVAPLQIIGLAQGYSPDHNVNLHVGGPNDVLVADLIFQPGAQTGWHSHPGPVVVVIKSGALTETHSNGCITVHPQGSVFFEPAGEIHNATNDAAVVTEVYATFLSPAGASPLIPQANPGGVCRRDD